MRVSKTANRRRKRRQGIRLERLEQRVVLSTVLWHPAELGANDDGVVVRKDSGAVDVDVLQNDYGTTSWYGQAGRDKLRVVSVTKPEQGAIGIGEDGRSVKYTPSSGFIGIDSFSYTIEDGAGETDEARVFVRVAEPLFAMDDWFRVEPEADNVVLEVLRNDSLNVAGFAGGSPQSPMRIKSVSEASHQGALSVAEDGQSLIYSPISGFSGQESFTYTIEDQAGYRAEATVRVEVLSPSGGELPTPSEQLRQLLLEAALERSQAQFGQFSDPSTFKYYWATPRVIDPLFAVDASFDDDMQTSLQAVSTNSDSATEFSGTNIQVAGVDEGDVVKTDGDYLYVLSDWFNEESSTQEHQLIIVDITEPAAPAVVSRYEFDGDIVEAYLSGDRVTVLSQTESTVVVSLLDVADRAAPTLVGESRIDGQLKTTRAIGELLYVVADAYDADRLPMPTSSCLDEETGCFYETKREFVGRVRDGILESLPQVETRDESGEVVDERGLLESSQLVAFNFAENGGLSAVLTYNISISAETATPVASTSFAHGVTSEIYMSSNALYIFERSHGSGRESDDVRSAFESVTNIDKLSLAADGQVRWEASGSVDGHLLNRFSADEFDGYLRVATTTSMWGGTSSLYVLEQSGEVLEVVGSVEGLAPGERIFSARFDGTRGFVVTFRQVDPLFVFDLSDPTDPELLGELKVTGYSNYLQLIDENHLLGIGREANGNGFFQELQVSLFDISDLSNPALLHRYGFEGGRELWSPILQGPWNLGTHHSVSYFPASQTLVMPVYEGEGGWWSWAGDSAAAVSMSVLDIDVDQGITSRGLVDFDQPFDPDRARAVRVGDVLYSISPDLIKANELLSPANQVGEIYIGAGATDDRFQLRGGPSQALDVLSNDLTSGAEGGREIVSVSQPARGGEVTIDEDSGAVMFQPEQDYVGTVTFSYTMGAPRYRDVATVTVDVKRQWHNDVAPNDVNRDGRTSPIDVLDFINFIHKQGMGGIDELESRLEQFAGESDRARTLRPDANNDGYISSMDLLLMVNYLNSLDLREVGLPGSGFKAEGEAERPSWRSAAPSAEDLDAAIEDLTFGSSEYGSQPWVTQDSAGPQLRRAADLSELSNGLRQPPLEEVLES